MADNREGKQDQRSTLAFWLTALQVRLRMFGFFLALATFFATWPWLSATWDRWLGQWQRSPDDLAVSSAVEFFCPMDPGVLSTWPAICPICNMDLIRRKKSDAQLLPEGVVARMQLTPYKLTLAGVRTVEVTKKDGDPATGDANQNSASSSEAIAEVYQVPVTSVVYHEQQPLVYVESMAGMFDAIPVEIKGGSDQVKFVSGKLIAGSRVAAMGTLLLDAESRLKPNLATQYFGAAQSSLAASPPALPAAASSKQATLSTEDQKIVDQQQRCPVTEAPLGSMGKPVIVEVASRRVALCCMGCKARLLANPEKYLQWLDEHK